MSSTSIVRDQIESVTFTMNTDNEIRAISVLEVTSPVAFDQLGNALPHGLYDQRLGPLERGINCPTCSQSYLNCPGHASHIELSVPLYNPLAFSQMLLMMKMKCQNCHSFKCGEKGCRVFEAKINLIDRGCVREAMELDDELSKMDVREGNLDANNSDDDGETMGTKNGDELDAPLRLSKVDKFLAEKASSSVGHDKVVLSSHERRIKREIIQEFMTVNRASTKKCESCGAISPGIRQDASNKIFQSALTGKAIKHNEANHARITPASMEYSADAAIQRDDVEDEHTDDDESDDDDDDDEGGKPAAAKKQSDKFVHPLEVMKQIEITWRKCPSTCCHVFGCAHVSDITSLQSKQEGFTIFFSRVVSVTPARFRPPMSVANMTVEHSQNFYLNKIITANQTIRESIESEKVMANGNNSSSSDSDSDSENNKAATPAAAAGEQSYERAKRGRTVNVPRRFAPRGSGE